jgi:hypothetical protein
MPGRVNIAIYNADGSLLMQSALHSIEGEERTKKEVE